jgi:hypothetical protein
MEAVQVAQYVSDSSDVGILAENNEISQNQKQRKGTKHWIKDVSDTAIEALAGDTRSNTIQAIQKMEEEYVIGVKKVKICRLQCSASIYL